MKSLTVESEYGRELFQEMKRIRQVVRQKIQKAQKLQKYQYDKHVKESKIEVDDLVMLKVEPTFKWTEHFVDHTEFIMSRPHVLVYNQLTALMKRLYLYHCNVCHVVMYQCWRISSHG